MDSLQKGSGRTIYHCKSCNTDSKYKHGIISWIVILMLVFPLIEFLIRAVLEITLQPVLGTIFIGDLEIYRVISIGTAILATLLLFIKLNRLVVINR